MSKTFQMPVEFFTDVYKLVGLLDGRWPDDVTKSLCNTIEVQIKAKLAAIERRESFSAYRSAPSGTVERENLRQDYLNLSGIGQDWRTEKESHF